MTGRILFPALVFSLALVKAQTPPAPEMPEDAKAYREALRITDADKKLAAMEKLKSDFPSSTYVQTADEAILGTLLKSKPDEQARIRKTADAIYKAATVKDKEASRGATIVSTRNRESAAAQIAEQFLTADRFPKEADAWARRSVGPDAPGHLDQRTAGGLL